MNIQLPITLKNSKFWVQVRTDFVMKEWMAKISRSLRIAQQFSDTSVIMETKKSVSGNKCIGTIQYAPHGWNRN